ncbi:MAG: hypothetical protein AAF493_26050 [Pseudomonadota bacterium]
MRILKRPSSMIFAAPHGGFDLGTARIATMVCERVQWNCLIARGYRTKTIPLNVNRPTEGVGLSPSQERHTSRAKTVYAEYAAKWRALNGPRATLYVELHGNSRVESAGRLEIAVVGMSKRERDRVECVFRRGLARSAMDGLEVWVEGNRRIWYRARSTKRFGILGETPRALHIEVPRRFRRSGTRAQTASFLIDVLPQLETLDDDVAMRRLQCH